jgi:hypothetical protein
VPLSNRDDYDRAFAVVRKVIAEWDPYGLIGGGAPLDEWDSAVAKIVAQIPRIGSATDAAHAVSRTFSHELEGVGFSPDDCAAVGSQLFEALVNASILQSSSSPAA